MNGAEIATLSEYASADYIKECVEKQWSAMNHLLVSYKGRLQASIDEFVGDLDNSDVSDNSLRKVVERLRDKGMNFKVYASAGREAL